MGHLCTALVYIVLSLVYPQVVSPKWYSGRFRLILHLFSVNTVERVEKEVFEKVVYLQVPSVQ